MWAPNNIKNLISEIYILNFFQKCKLIEKVEKIDSKSELKEIETILLKIRKLQDNLLKKALNNNKNVDKIWILQNLLSSSKASSIRIMEEKEKNNENLDDLINKLWND